jgi:hypothetical protein
MTSPPVNRDSTQLLENRCPECLYMEIKGEPVVGDRSVLRLLDPKAEAEVGQ